MDDFENLINAGDNVPAINYQEYYKAVLEQIFKDFHPYKPHLEIPEILSSSFLREVLRELLSDKDLQSYGNMQQILYRIDISEKKLVTVQNQSNANNRMDHIVEMILRREAQKVWVRKKFG